MKMSALKTAFLALLMFVALGVTAQTNGGKTFTIANPSNDIVKAQDGSTRTVSFTVDGYATQADVDQLVNSMSGRSGVTTFTVGAADANGVRQGTMVADGSVSHLSLVKYLDASGVETMSVNGESTPIRDYAAFRRAKKAQNQQNGN